MNKPINKILITLALTIVLFAVTSLIFVRIGPPPIAKQYGFPLAFFYSGTSTAAPPEGGLPFSNFNLLNVIIDVIFWYLLISLIWFIYTNITNKSRKTT